MQTVFTSKATIFILDGRQWIELANCGDLTLIQNNSDDFDIRLTFEANGERLQCHLKPHELKSKGTNSWLFRYQVIIIRFD